MAKIDIELSSKRLLSIFSSRGIEQPWRFQDKLQIHIPFEEYVAFVSEIVKSDYTWLAFPMDSYRKALHVYSENPQNMIRLFYNDISFAQYYEWDLALEDNKGCSLILPKFDTDEVLDIRDIGEHLSEYTDDEAFAKVLESLPRRMPKCVTTETQLSNGRYFDIKEYIIFLRCLMFTPNCKKINFKEDS